MRSAPFFDRVGKWEQTAATALARACLVASVAFLLAPFEAISCDAHGRPSASVSGSAMAGGGTGTGGNGLGAAGMISQDGGHVGASRGGVGGFSSGAGGAPASSGGAAAGSSGSAPLPGSGGSAPLPGSGGNVAHAGSAGGQGAAPAFPLKLSSSKRYLVDQTGAPFLINQASSWGLIQSLSTADAKDYLDALQQRGFNSVLVSIISYDTRMAGTPPNWQGVPPFNVQWDFSSYNDAYFAHADEILNLAKARGMLVALVPSYLGYAGDQTEGWMDEILSANNSVAKSTAYGRYLGNRYKDFTNIIWVAGGDNMPPAGSELESRLKGVIDGIKQNDPSHLWTAHWGGNNSVWSVDNPTFVSYLDINGYYAYDYGATQALDLANYNRSPVLMTYHLDQSYETEPGGTPENIRRKAYEAILSGAAGSSFCAGPNWYLFFNWRSNMDTPGTQQTKIWYQAMVSRPWSELVPDQGHTSVTTGFGDVNGTDYVAAARTPSGSTIMAFMPSSRAVTLDLTKVSGTQARVWWYDPTNGKATSGGTFPTSGRLDLTPPGSGDWLLVIDGAAENLPAPGVLNASNGTAVPWTTSYWVLVALILAILVIVASGRRGARQAESLQP